MVKQPVISKELIAYLEEAFRFHVPEDAVHDPNLLNVAVGQQQVLNHLRAVNAQQEEASYV